MKKENDQKEQIFCKRKGGLNILLKKLNKHSEASPNELGGTSFYRHTVTVRNTDGSYSAYCFAVPVYTASAGELVELSFCHKDGKSVFMGSNACVTVDPAEIRLQNGYGSCTLLLDGRTVKRGKRSILRMGKNGRVELRPTLNGLMLLAECGEDRSFALTLQVDRPFLSQRANDKYFAIMREKFTPFVTVSCIGAMNAREEVVSPCRLQFQKIDACEYELTLTHEGETGSRIAFEINLQEPKLFLDTTVESKHPSMNNAYGGTAFLGMTEAMGEQWLYSRVEQFCVPQLWDREILRATLYLPTYGQSRGALDLNRISARFCSFGSTWENKIDLTDHVARSSTSGAYRCLDITPLFDNIKRHAVNFAIRAAEPQDAPVIISTGDSFYKPQFLKVEYRSEP